MTLKVIYLSDTECFGGNETRTPLTLSKNYRGVIVPIRLIFFCASYHNFSSCLWLASGFLILYTYSYLPTYVGTSLLFYELLQEDEKSKLLAC